MNATVRAVLGWTAALLVFAAGTLGAVFRGQGREIVVVNPLERDLSVRFGAREVLVPESGETRVRLRPGVYDVETRTASEVVLDRHRLVLPPFRRGTAVYNVFGAAPIYRFRIRYDGEGVLGLPFGGFGPPSGFDGFEPLAGPRLRIVEADAVLDHSDPEQLRGGFGTVRTCVARAPGGWGVSLDMLARSAPDAEIRELLGRLGRLLPDELELPEREAAFAAASEGPGAALALARLAIRRSPLSTSAHRAFVRLMQIAGREAELRETYRALARRDPDSPIAAAMLLRALPRAEAEAAANAALGSRYASEDRLWIAGQVLLGTGHARDAAASFARITLRSGDPRPRGDRVRALVLSGDPEGAAAVALELARLDDADAEDLATFLRAAALPGANPEVAPEKVLSAWKEAAPESERAARALAGRSPRPAEAATAAPVTAATILEWTPWDPARALALCRGARPGILASLPPSAGGLLALEAYRLGDRETFERLRWNVPLSAAEIAAYVERGAEPGALWRLDPDRRTALALARERWLGAAGSPVPPAVAREARADPLRGLATLAAERWPAPAPNAPPRVLVLDAAPRP